MKLHKISILLILFFLSVPLICHAVDLNDLYASDYDAFWKAWNKSKQKAARCNDYNETATFLSNALSTLINAEVTEANKEIIETLIIKKPKCVMETLLRLKTDELEKVLYNFILAPIYHEQFEINNALKKYWKSRRYQKIKEDYQKIEGEKSSQQNAPGDAGLTAFSFSVSALVARAPEHGRSEAIITA